MNSKTFTRRNSQWLLKNSKASKTKFTNSKKKSTRSKLWSKSLTSLTKISESSFAKPLPVSHRLKPPRQTCTNRNSWESRKTSSSKAEKRNKKYSNSLSSFRTWKKISKGKPEISRKLKTSWLWLKEIMNKCSWWMKRKKWKINSNFVSCKLGSMKSFIPSKKKTTT